MSDDLASLDATAQAELVRAGHASPIELVDAAIARIEKLNPELNAVIHERFERAREEAAGDLPDGPFRGVPMVVKDLMCHQAGEPFHEGMGFLRRLGWTARGDSWLAARFRAAGFVTVGRTNTPELGILPTTEPLAYGPSRNPWDTGRSTGGSSGGSAASVAAGLVPVGHANDGGGSIRIPASECGLVGLKPTRGRTTQGPEFGDVMSGLVCEHVVTRSVRDTAAILDAVAGPGPGDPYVAPPPARPWLSEVGVDPGPLRIGVTTAAPGGMAVTHADCVAGANAAAELLASLGHEVDEAGPDGLDDTDYIPQFLTLWSSGVAWNLDHWSRVTGEPIGQDDVEPLTWALAEMGRSYSGPALLAAVEWLQHHNRVTARFWDPTGSDDRRPPYDLWLTPTIAEPPPPLGEFDSTPDNPLAGIFRAAAVVPFTPPLNVTGQPAISLPLHWNDAGLPIGVQLVAAPGREDLLIQVAAQLESAAPWSTRMPPVHA